jgi:hypothetical protein
VAAISAVQKPILRRIEMFRVRALALVAVAAIGLFTASSANAQIGYYGLLSNNTGMQVNYQFKINNGAWTNATLMPGGSVYFGVPLSYFQTYKGAQYVVQIRYDSLVGAGVVTQTKNLVLQRAYSPAGGYPNKFLLSNPYNQRIWIYLGS